MYTGSVRNGSFHTLDLVGRCEDEIAHAALVILTLSKPVKAGMRFLKLRYLVLAFGIGIA